MIEWLRKRLCPKHEKDWCGQRKNWTHIVPDWLPSLGCIAECCKDHDYHYQVGGSADDRELADSQFYHCLMARGRARAMTWWGLLPKHKERAEKATLAYYLAVRAKGASGFNFDDNLDPGVPKE